MSLSNTILSAVDTVFRSLGTIKTSVTLSTSKVTGFDHTNMVPIYDTNGIETTIDVIEINRSIDKDGTDVITYIAKYSDVPLETYQSLVVGTQTYKIISMKPTQNFIVEIEVAKEK